MKPLFFLLLGIPILVDAQKSVDPVYARAVTPRTELIDTILRMPKIMLPREKGQIVFTDIKADSATEIQLHKRAKDWFINTFNDSRAVIKNEDEHSLIGTGEYDNVTFNVEIDYKDNKYRIRFYGFYYTWNTVKYPIDNIYSAYLTETPFFKVILFESDRKILTTQAAIVYDLGFKMKSLIYSVASAMRNSSNDISNNW